MGRRPVPDVTSRPAAGAPVKDALLSLVEVERALTGPSGQRSARLYLDFVIDGVPLADRIRRLGFDMVSPLWVNNATAAPSVLESVERLLGRLPGDAPLGRVSVYVCAECGDLGCGAVTVQLSFTAQCVTWSAGDSKRLPVTCSLLQLSATRNGHQFRSSGTTTRALWEQQPIACYDAAW